MIRAQIADTPELRAAANEIIAKKYAAAGYGCHGLACAGQAVPLVVVNQDQVIGTMTISCDSSAGLLVDQGYVDYVNNRRRPGKLCAEITKLAFESPSGSIRAIDVGFSFAVGLLTARGVTDLFIEVNPKQVRFYHRRLGFWPIGDETNAERVTAPARLMWVETQILSKTIHRKKIIHQRLPKSDVNQERAFATAQVYYVAKVNFINLPCSAGY
jgi:hypothetical protein